MLDEIISSLQLKPGDRALDATIGGGGHAIEILKRISPGGLLIGLDADASAVNISRERLKEFGPSLRIVQENFRDLDIVLSNEGITGVDAVLMDVGISSDHLADASRGFSIQKDGPLDMRMDTRLTISAYDIVNRYKEQDLSDVIKNFGEERFHYRIARRIAEERAKKPIETTGELKEVIYRAVGGRRGYMRIDPATRTFQAIRIAVNDELGALEEGVKKAVSALKPGARICVIAFHSLEDRIVKNLFKSYSAQGVLRIVTKKPMRPSDEEAASNPRARSARLRVAERHNSE
jgi:16S rRNA (cytosine1402-N4)-methyltransferase